MSHCDLPNFKFILLGKPENHGETLCTYVLCIHVHEYITCLKKTNKLN